MHQRLAEIVAFLDGARADLLRDYCAIPESRRGERPAADAWTPAEVLDHLAIVEGGIARLVEKRVSRASESGAALVDHGTSSLLGALDHFPLESRERRMTSPEVVRPRVRVSPADAEAAIARSREALRAAVTQGEEFDLTTFKAIHPFLGELDLYQWILFVGKHERRHAAQLRAAEALFAEGSASSAAS